MNASVFKNRNAPEVAIAAGVALVSFEIVEFAAIGFMPLQALEGVIGLVVVALAAQRMAARRRLA